MSESNQEAVAVAVAATETEQVQTIRIGFEAALDEMDPEWKTTWGTAQVHAALHFYNAGVATHSQFTSNYVNNVQTTVKDITEALGNASAVYAGHLQEGVNWIQSNVLETLTQHKQVQDAAAESAGDITFGAKESGDAESNESQEQPVEKD